jgi:hypothetical protein
MRAALIPPKGYYNSAAQSDYHLALAQLPDQDYIDLYANLDVMGDTAGTISRAEQFFAGLKSKKDFNFNSVKYMGVVQSHGDNGSAMECIHAFDRLGIHTLGIPRHLLSYDKYARYNLLNLIKGYDLHNRFEVHLLGTNPIFPVEVSVIAEAHPWVRGVDSSLPYNYSIAGKRLTASFLPTEQQVGRPEGYFDEIRKIDTDLLQDNIDTFMRWASGIEGTAR